MNILKILLLGVLYFLGSSTSWTLGIGYYTLYRPVIIGGVTGLLFGDALTGFCVGALVNILFLNFTSTGGSLKRDPCLTGLVSAICATYYNIGLFQSVAISFLFGYIGLMVWNNRLSINTYFVKKYEQHIIRDKKSYIFCYNALFPQLLLLIGCIVIVSLSVCILFLLPIIYKHIGKYTDYILTVIGMSIIFNSVISHIISIKNIKNYVLLAISVLLALILNKFIVMYILVAILLGLTYLDFKANKNNNETENESKKRTLNIGDIFISWFLWMNFCHACYNFERMQGLGFAHSMKYVIKKLYTDKEIRLERMKYYTDFFNCEPNVGTPIMGITIGFEEDKSREENTIEINNAKKSMMGVVSGMGDSFTQVILAPVFFSICTVFALNKCILGTIITALALSCIILFISFNGYKNGYYKGRKYLFEEVKIIKDSKFFKYQSYISVCTLGYIIATIGQRVFNINYIMITLSLLIAIIALGLSIIQKKYETTKKM